MRRMLAFLAGSGRGRIGLVLVGLFLLAAFVGRWVMPYDPQEPDPLHILSGFSSTHPFGTDQLGRDQLSRILQAALPMLRITGISVGVSLVAGTLLGVVAGFLGGAIDSVVMRALDLLMAFPVLIMAIAIVGFFGPGERNVMIALAIAFVPGFARVARAATLTVSTQPYVLAARSIGDGNLQIALRQVVPNILPVMLVQASLSSAYAILGESALSFLGLSVQPPVSSWGRMLAEGRDFLSVSPHLAAVPGAMITLVVLGFNLVGDGLRDYLDPTLREQVR